MIDIEQRALGAFKQQVLTRLVSRVERGRNITHQRFDLLGIRRWLLDHKRELALVVDFMHGSSRGYVQSLLGAEVVRELAQAELADRPRQGLAQGLGSAEAATLQERRRLLPNALEEARWLGQEPELRALIARLEAQAATPANG